MDDILERSLYWRKRKKQMDEEKAKEESNGSPILRNDSRQWAEDNDLFFRKPDAKKRKNIMDWD